MLGEGLALLQGAPDDSIKRGNRGLGAASLCPLRGQPAAGAGALRVLWGCFGGFAVEALKAPPEVALGRREGRSGDVCVVLRVFHQKFRLMSAQWEEKRKECSEATSLSV